MKKFFGTNRRNISLLAFGFFLVPQLVFAEVVINEVAWMGTEASSGNEWIELKNTGSSSVDVSGWMMVIGNAEPDNISSGTIPAGGFFLLERTDDSSVPSVSAGAIYAGALSNSGKKLVLKNASSEPKDTLKFTSGWPAGNNEKKYTMQKKGDGWISARPTPGAENATVDLEKKDKEDDTSDSNTNNGGGTDTSNNENNSSDEEEDEDEETTDDGETSSHLSPVSIKDFHPVFTLTTDAGRERIGTPNTPIPFDARASTSTAELLDDADFSWTFGDGSEKRGEKVEHTFYFPGVYNVVLHTQFKGQKAVDRTTVIIYSPKLSIASVKTGEDGYVMLINKGNEEVNIGGYRLESDDGTFKFPKDTIIEASTTVKFSNSLLDLPLKDEIDLLYPNGTLIFEYLIAEAHREEKDGKVLGARISRIEIKLEQAKEKLALLLGKVEEKRVKEKEKSKEGLQKTLLPKDQTKKKEKKSSQAIENIDQNEKKAQKQKKIPLTKDLSSSGEKKDDLKTIVVVGKEKSLWEKFFDFLF